MASFSEEHMSSKFRIAYTLKMAELYLFETLITTYMTATPKNLIKNTKFC
jgi:hypothetical protein